MRVIAAVVLVMAMAVIGFVALSQQAQDVEPTLNDSGEETAYNVSTGVFEGTGHALANLIPYAGVGAGIVVTLGFLVASARSGR